MNDSNQNNATTAKVKGGVVSIQDVLDFIQTTTSSLSEVFNVIKNSGGGIKWKMNAIIANQQLKIMKGSLLEFVNEFSNMLSEIADIINSKLTNDKLDGIRKLLGTNPAILNEISDTNSVPQSLINGNVQEVGIIPMVVGISGTIRKMGDMKMVNPLILAFKMAILTANINVIINGISLISDTVHLHKEKLNVESATTLEILQKMLQFLNNILNEIYEFKKAFFKLIPQKMLKMLLRKLRQNIETLLRGMSQICSTISRYWIQLRKKMPDALETLILMVAAVKIIDYFVSSTISVFVSIALSTIILPFLLPIAIVGIMMLITSIFIITSVLRIVGSRMMGRYLTHILIRIAVNMFLLSLIFATIALTAIHILVIIGVTILAGLLIKYFVFQFLIGLVAMVFVFILIVGALWILSKLGTIAAKVGFILLLKMIILVFIIGMIAISLLILAIAAWIMQDNVANIFWLLGAMGLILVGMLGFILLAGTLALPIAIGGAIALVSITIGVLCLVAMAVLMVLLVIVAKYVDPTGVLAATKKILNAAFDVVNSVIEANLSEPENEESQGFMDKVLSLIAFGPIGVILSGSITVFNLLGKLMAFVITFFIICVLFLMMLMLKQLTKYVAEHSNLLTEGKEAAKSVLAACSEIIKAVTDAEFSTPHEGPVNNLEEGLKALLGPTIYSVVKLFFTMAIVLETVIVLFAMKFMIEQILELQKFITEKWDVINKAKEDLPKVVGICGDIINAVTGTGDKAAVGSEEDGVLTKLIRFLSPDIATMFNLLGSFMLIAMATVSMMLMKWMLGHLMDLLQAYQDAGGAGLTQRVETMITDIVTACGKINSVVSGDGVKGEITMGKNPLGSALKYIFNFVGLGVLASAADLLFTFAYVGMAMVSLVMLQTLLKSITLTVEYYNKCGGVRLAKRVKSMVDEINETINVLMNAFESKGVTEGQQAKSKGAWGVIKSIGEKVWNGAKTFVKAGANKIAGATGMSPIIMNIQYLVSVLENLNTLMHQLVETSNLSSKTMAGALLLRVNIGKFKWHFAQIINSLANWNSGDLSSAAQKMRNVQSILESIAIKFNNMFSGDTNNKTLFDKLFARTRQFQNIVNNNGKFISDINRLNIAKAEALAKVFGNAAAFSQSIKGRIDELAKTVHELTTKTVQELKDAIEVADKHIQKNAEIFAKAAKQIGDAGSGISGAATSINNLANQIQSTGGGIGVGGTKIGADHVGKEGGYTNSGDINAMHSPYTVWDKTNKRWTMNKDTILDDDCFTMYKGYPCLRVYLEGGQMG